MDNIKISIHAPTRGATFISLFHSLGNYYFNPRSHERSDLCGISTTAYPCDFNPRSHERSDEFLICALSSKYYFNPRSHERSDLFHSLSNTVTFISIHAPTRGATDIIFIGGIKSIFQSTLPREERPKRKC